jgi:hypothetical protein
MPANLPTRGGGPELLYSKTTQTQTAHEKKQ